jgi:hypothetical protein
VVSVTAVTCVPAVASVLVVAPAHLFVAAGAGVITPAVWLVVRVRLCAVGVLRGGRGASIVHGPECIPPRGICIPPRGTRLHMGHTG